MSDPRRKTCSCCGRNSDEVGNISWNGYCGPCGKTILFENIDGIAARSGFAHERRLRGIERYVNRARLDAQRATP